MTIQTLSYYSLGSLNGNPEALRDEIDADIKNAETWTDEEIRYASEVPEGYEDISKKLQYFL